MFYNKNTSTGNVDGELLIVAPIFSFEYEYVDNLFYTPKIGEDSPNIELTSLQKEEVRIFSEQFILDAERDMLAKATADKIQMDASKEEIDASTYAQESEDARKQAIYDSEPYLSDREKREYLTSTDWYVTRKVERGIDIPAEISTKRLEVATSIQEGPLYWDDI